MVGQRGNRGGGGGDPRLQGGANWGMGSDMGGSDMQEGYGAQGDTSMYSQGSYNQGGKKRTYNESQDGYSMSGYYDTSDTDPYYRGMDPPSSRFQKTDTGSQQQQQQQQQQQPQVDQYASYYENWDSGYYNESGIGQGNFNNYGYQTQGSQQQQQQQSGGYGTKSGDFSQDIDFPSNNSSNFSKVYNKNQQSWNKRGGGGGGGGRGGRGQQQQQWGQAARGGRGQNRGGRGGPNRGAQGGGMMGEEDL